MQACLGVSRSLWWRRGSMVDCCRVGGTGCSSVCMGPIGGGHHYLYNLHLRSNNREGTQPCPSTENWIKDLLSTALPIRSRPFLSQSVSPIRKRPSASYPSPSEGRQNENHNHRKPNCSHGPQACLTQRNYEPCHVGPTQVERAMVESSDKT